ncbi:hypothetical protein F5882DRAFT_50199 [Hyaloscypha sp. PMI_1271]|nr:hypothetical protein F5882DRAFT_50199 [Hyaloscypha sp. PMI_1271]
MAYKKDLNRATYESGRVMQDFLICKSLEGDLEDFSFVGQGPYQNNSFLISNLGVFEPREEMVDGGWSIKDVGFSSGVIRAVLSDFGPVFDVASVKGGDCVISARYEEGLLKDAMVKDLSNSVLTRLKLLI